MKILCYGDSNTYGYDGTDPFGGRLPETSRWPELLGKSAGIDCLNCGMNGRKVPHFQRSVDADLRLLSRAKDGDFIIVMLGTNDLLSGAEPEDTAACMRGFLEKLKSMRPECVILLAAPPSVFVDGEDFSDLFSVLAEQYNRTAQELGVYFVDTMGWKIPTVGDGIHFAERGHKLFAQKMHQSIHMLTGGIL